MAVNKVIYDGDTLIDLSGDTVTASQLLSGATAHDKAGNPITGTYKTPSGTINITANGTHNIVSYASAAVNVPIKWGYTTVTGNGTGTLRVSGLPFRPLGFVMYPYSVVAWSTQNQIVACGDAGQRFNIMRTSQTNTLSYGSLNGLDENGVSGSGSNWSFTASHTALVFRNGMTYRVLYWGV